MRRQKICCPQKPVGDGWSLSLISPNEWNDDARRRAFVGKCVLHVDSTWSITPSGNIGRQGTAANALSEFYDGFIDKLRSQRVLEDCLPYYEAGLPCYQRLFAAAPSRSSKGSLALADQLGISAETWLTRMPRARAVCSSSVRRNHHIDKRTVSLLFRRRP